MAVTRKEGSSTIHVSPWKVQESDFFDGNIAEFVLNSPHWDKQPNKPILIDALNSQNHLSPAEIKSILGKLSFVLREKYGIVEGDAVCLLLTNAIELPALHMGILAVGGVVSPANIAYLPNELHHQLKVSQAKLIISLDEYRETAVRATTDFESVPVRNVISLKQIWQEALAAKGTLAPVKFQPGESKSRHAYYCFSSGTSGTPKGVTTTHQNIISNVTQSIISLQDNLYRPGSVFGAVLPMSHIYGLSTFIYTLPYLANTTVVFPKFDFKQLLERIAEHKISVLHIVPPMAVEFAKNPLLDQYPEVRGNLQSIMSGAAPLSESLSDSLIARIGCKIYQAYGLTETSPMCLLPSFDTKIYNCLSVGWLIPGLEARLVDVDGKDVHGINARGELWLRGPNVMAGYLKNPEATAEVFVESADHPLPWLRTGDVALVDETGQWYIVDRFKELIKSKGHQVAPAELESILLSHPDVVDVAVAGIYLPEEGTELPRAFVVLRNNVSPLAIKQWFDARVSRHKRLWGGLVVVSSVPKTASGKIQRRLLRDRTGDEVVGYRSSAPKL